jgi:hypothetical protein
MQYNPMVLTLQAPHRKHFNYFIFDSLSRTEGRETI